METLLQLLPVLAPPVPIQCFSHHFETEKLIRTNPTAFIGPKPHRGGSCKGGYPTEAFRELAANAVELISGKGRAAVIRGFRISIFFS